MKAIVILAAFVSLTGLAVAEKPAPVAPVKIGQAEKLLSSGVQLVDVRTKEEWDEGHLQSATRITVTEADFLGKSKAKLDPKKPVLVYCRSGTRSADAAAQLRGAGFTVYDLAGGISAWQKAGRLVVK